MLRASPRGTADQRRAWFLLASVIGLVAFGLRLVPVLRGGGLFGLGNYDDGVYFAAATALAHGLLPYRDFLLLHPPGIVLALAPFALLGRLVGDPAGFAAARLAWMGLGALNAVLVGQIVRPLGLAVAGLGALLYAVAVPAVYIEHTTLIEGPASTCVLLALLAVRPRDGRALPSAGLAITAGALLGASATFKIWGAAAVLAVLGWFVATRALRTARQLLAGAAGAVGLICLPFFVAAPLPMWQMVVLDQLGRPRGSISVLNRLGDIVGFGLLRPAGPRVTPLLIVVLVGVAVLLLLAWTVPIGRLATVLTLVLIAVLLASPSWFLHYPGLATGPLCAALAAGTHRLAERAGAVRRPLGPVVLVLVAGAALVQADPLVHFTAGSHFPGTTLGRAAAGGACVTSDDPAALIEMDVLGRDLARGCPFVADIGGYSYEVARRTGQPSGRRQDAAWQQIYLNYLRTGNLSVPFRYGRSGSLSASTTSAVRRWPTVARVGAFPLRRTAPGS